MPKLLSILALAVLPCVAGCDNKKPAGGSGPAASGSAASATSVPSGGVIKLGQTMPYSGPASSYGIIGKVEQAYFKMVDEKGGVNGRKVELLSFDDGYNPSKTLEQTRKLVENEGILADFGGLGTPTQSAVHGYLNEKKVPHVFVASGAEKWVDPQHFPWTIGFQPSYQTEGRIFAKYILDNKPNAKVCILEQNDDFGKDYVTGLKAGLGAQFDKLVVKTVTYEVTDPTIDSQIVALQSSGCEAVMLATSPKFGAQAIRKIYDIGWKPTELLSSASTSITAVLKVAGLEKANGAIIAAYLKDPSDPKTKDDPGIVEYREFMKKYAPDIDIADWGSIYGYTAVSLMTKVLEACGAEVSRESIMKTALHLHDIKIPTVLDGITINTTPERPRTMTQMQVARFNGASYDLVGNVLDAD